ncbi:hypothetical protein KSP40_PGU000962 [Platanthera guangdongensis]|uniref:Uncharacterized protein n=1 Tax=Platanthera guangdongensis TaxID=2320717 RepID=A0ABR2M348_9ASPA
MPLLRPSIVPMLLRRYSSSASTELAAPHRVSSKLCCASDSHRCSQLRISWLGYSAIFDSTFILTELLFQPFSDCCCQWELPNRALPADWGKGEAHRGLLFLKERGLRRSWRSVLCLSSIL